MRKIAFLLFVLFPALAFCGPDLAKQVSTMLTRIDSCTSAQQIDAIISEYEDISKEFGRDWRSHYWLAYGYLKKAEYTFDDSNKDQALDQAQTALKPAILLDKDNPEVMLLEALILWKRIEINPDERANRYTFRMEDLLRQAFKNDQLNPRFYYVKGIIALSDTIMNPENKKKAKDYFLSGEKVYGAYTKNAEDADPQWGYGQMRLYLNVLAPNRNFFYTRGGVYVDEYYNVETLDEVKEIRKDKAKEEKERLKAQKKAERDAKRAERGKNQKFIKEKEELENQQNGDSDNADSEDEGSDEGDAEENSEKNSSKKDDKGKKKK